MSIGRRATVNESWGCIRDDDMIPVFKLDVLLRVLPFDRFLVVETESLVPAQNLYFPCIGPLLETAGFAERLEHPRRRGERIRTGLIDKPIDVIFPAPHLRDPDGHLRAVDICG